MNKQEKLEATAIIAPVIRANAKANSKRKVTTYDQATGKTVRETTVLVLQDSLLAKAEILGVDVKQELKRGESRACRKCGELRKSKFANKNSQYCALCIASVSNCDCGRRLHTQTVQRALRKACAPMCNLCAKKHIGKIRSKPRLYCYKCSAILPASASAPSIVADRCGKPPMCVKCSVSFFSGLARKLKRKSASGHRGVRFKGKKWCAILEHKGRCIRIGTYISKRDAARAYDIAACDILGINAICNFGEAMYI